MKEIISAKDVKLGMFVVELDRPWLGTPFALQGFLIDSPGQVEKLRELCDFVAIDRSFSVGEHFAAPKMPYAKAPRSGMRPAMLVQQRDPSPQRPGFLDVVRVISRSGRGRAKTSASNQVTRTDSLGAAEGLDLREAPVRGISQELMSAPAEARRSSRARSATIDEERITRNHARGLASLLSFERVASIVGRTRQRTIRTRKDDLEHVVEAPVRTDARVTVRTAYVDQATVEEEILASSDLIEQAQDIVQDITAEMSKDKLPQMERVRDAVEGMVGSVVRNPDALMWLAQLKRSDNYTYDHALDVSVHLLAFGRHLGLPLSELNMLGTAGLMQDLGKIKLPPGLLRKKTPLTRNERLVVRRHVEFSIQILSNQPGTDAHVLDVAAKHHERIDGSGYPLGLKGDAVGLYAEMAGLVDSYCAMTTPRCFAPAVDNHRALERIYAMRNRTFSESVVLEFIQCLSLYPVGTLVELNTGEVGVVIAQNRVRRLKPRLLLMLDPDKKPKKSPTTLDLMAEPMMDDETPYHILRALPARAYGIDPREFYL